jgi:hypothetical protein
VRKLASIAVLAISLFLAARRSDGQQNPAPAWLTIVISAPVASTQSVQGFISSSTESFINDTCQPSELDGIQVLSVQIGHNEVFHLHVYCRQDNAAAAHYKVTMVPVPNHTVNETAKLLLGKAKMRVGPLYLGATGEPDSILLIEKAR